MKLNTERTSLPRLVKQLMLAAGLFLEGASAWSQVTVGADSAQALWIQPLQRWIDEQVAIVQQQQPTLRLEVSLGTLDPRLQLASCAKVDPYLPVGSRLWGKSRLGLRCVDGSSRWNVFVPVTVRAFGPAWVLRGPMTAGALLGMNDVVESVVDWADEPSPVLIEATQWVGHVATRPLPAGQVLRQAMVKPPQVFQAGTQVRILTQGAGFSVMSDGQALSAGSVGQLVRVRVESGRIISGTVLDSHTVRVEL